MSTIHAPHPIDVAVNRGHRPRLHASLPALLVALLATAACGILEGEPDTRDQLRDARRLWASKEVDDYAFTVQRLCGECLPVWTRPYRVDVRGGAVHAVADEQTGSAAPLDYGRTVEGLFDFVQDALDRDAWRFSATYDPMWGFPTVVSVDYLEDAVDDEVVLRARDLAPTPRLWDGVF